MTEKRNRLNWILTEIPKLCEQGIIDGESALKLENHYREKLKNLPSAQKIFSFLVCVIGILMIAASALFSIITLPVEYNASARALDWLRSTRTLDSSQMEGATISLRWAARTYLVAALSAIATLLYYLGFARSSSQQE